MHLVATTSCILHFFILVSKVSVQDAIWPSGGPTYEKSRDREACVVNNALDSAIYPTEEYPDSAIRLAFRGVPFLKDLYLHVGRVYVEAIDLKVSVSRKSDKVFNFKITGAEDDTPAHIQIFAAEVDFATPKEKAAAIFTKGFSAITEALTGLTEKVTFGLVTQRGKITDMPGVVDLTMSADFELDDTGEWSLKVGSETQDLTYDFGNGGPLMLLAKTILDAVGTMDDLFLDILWPIVKMFIPPNIGKAFQRVPYKDGKLSLTTSVNGQCHTLPKGKHGCGTEQLDFLVNVDAHLSAHLEPIIRTIASNPDSNAPFIGFVAKNLVDQFDKKEPVKGSGHFTTSVDILGNHAVEATASPNLALPMSFLSAFLGSDVQLVDFLPTTGALSMKVGQLSFSGGHLNLGDVSFGGLKLPIGEEAFSIDGAVLNEFSMELDDTDQPEELGVFDPLSPLTIQTKGVQMELSCTKGLTMGQLIQNDTATSALILNVKPEPIDEQLITVGKNLQVPANVRIASTLKPDGVVPKYFEAPLPQAKPFLDLKAAIGAASGSVTLTVDEGPSENTDLTLSVPLGGTLSLTPAFFRGVLSSQMSDFGYAYMAVPVQFQKTRSLALLACGTLQIFEDLDEDAEPFTSKPDVEVDLAAIAEEHVGHPVTARDSDELDRTLGQSLMPEVSSEEFSSDFACCCKASPKECRAASKKETSIFPSAFTLNPNSCGWLIGRGWHRTEDGCSHLKCVKFAVGPAEGKSVCGLPDHIKHLVSAVTFQVARFANSPLVNKEKYSDATWFKTFDPYDITTKFPARDASETQVYSPQSEWRDAAKPIDKRSFLSQFLSKKALMKLQGQK